ncbi:sugar ABC transporter permease [Solirubrobacter sp. CPCC 204708]|uniref:Sugar ABC transporter permease n=1 Tax=Solirubrobacter deserti TaxID=2282478 RepID=A0ABT4RQU8_9ACTN|nr:sugar ABC transporter permease [Solirubrobacter deserti]MBE2320723.1 sugar ABC transporter permease [Solirubrobacter deserti]MDA0140947.1 sugar ABC transporter permease [Solirubrobacter deserti]
MRRRSTLWFVAPAFALYALVVLYPSLAGATSAFTDWSGVSGERRWVGLANFERLVSDSAGRAALRNVLALSVFVVAAQTVLGLGLALALHAAAGRRRWLRVAFLAPALVSPLVAAFVWRYVCSPAPDEGVNALLGFLGLDALQQDWLGDPSLALWSIGAAAVWQHTGYTVVIFEAGLARIPRDLHDAAKLDGAGARARLRYVVLPQLRPALTITVVLTTIGTLKLFDQVFALTGGGPGHATETPSTLIVREAFAFGRYGYSTAIALVLALIVAAVALVQLRTLREWELTR